VEIIAGRGIEVTKLNANTSAVSALPAESPVWEEAADLVWDADSVSPTLNNGTLDGAVLQQSSLATLLISWSRGSTTTNGTGVYSFSVPSNISTTSTFTVHSGMGSAMFTDASTGTNYVGVCQYIAGGGIMCYLSITLVTS
jgi:hypothetical protein